MSKSNNFVPSSGWRAITATHHISLGSRGSPTPTVRCCETNIGTLSRPKLTAKAPYPKVFSCPFLALVSWPFILANTASHQLKMVPQKKFTAIRIWDPMAACSVVLLQILVTVKAITLSLGWDMVLIYIPLSLVWTLQNSSQRLSTDWPPGLVPNRVKCSPLLGKPVKK